MILNLPLEFLIKSKLLQDQWLKEVTPSDQRNGNFFFIRSDECSRQWASWQDGYLKDRGIKETILVFQSIKLFQLGDFSKDAGIETFFDSW